MSIRITRITSPSLLRTHTQHVVPEEIIQANGGLLEYSVVYTDRALNHMSWTFCEVMKVWKALAQAPGSYT